MMDKYIKGCLLPHFEFVLSDHMPIKGSVMASNNKAIPIAAVAKLAGSPKT